MLPFGPLRRRDLIRGLQAAGFDGPFRGTMHDLMEKGNLRVRIPNPHEGDIDRTLLGNILQQAGIFRAEWERL